MKSVSQEHLIPQVEQAITHVLCEAAEDVGRRTGLIQRQGGQVTASNLAQTLVLGWMAHPNASLEMLAQQGAQVGLSISAQGVDQRFTAQAATFFQELFEVALGQVVMADPVALPLLSRFASVCLEDSSTVSLPPALSSVFAGKGGKGSSAACKVFVRLDMLRGGVRCSPLQDGKKGDGGSPLREHGTPARTLQLRDQGFINLDRWQQEQEQEQFVLSYLRSNMCVYDRQGHLLTLTDLLPQADPSGEWDVLVGSTQRVPMRLFFAKVPDEVAQQRRKRGRREAKERGQSYSKQACVLAGWTIAVTTVPAALLSLPEALVLLRLRWQIELLFKLWKEYGSLDEWRTKKPTRILCEIYAKLIGLLIQHWLLIISCWHLPHRSLVKAAKAVRGQVAVLSAALDGDLPLSRAIGRIQRVAGTGARLNSRRDAPNTSQLVQRGSSEWSSKPLRSWRPYRRKAQQFLA